MDIRQKRTFFGLEAAVTLLWLIMIMRSVFYPSTLLTLAFLWLLVWITMFRPQWLPALLAVVIPLEVSKQFIPILISPDRVGGFTVSYLEFFRLVQVAVGLRWLVDYWPRRRENWLRSFWQWIKKDSLLWLPLALLLAYLMSAAGSVAPRSSIAEIVRLLTFLTTFYMIIPYIKKPEDLRLMQIVLIGAGALLGIVALGEYLTGKFFFNATAAVVINKRANATFADPNILARFLVVTFFFTVAELERVKNWSPRLLALGALLMQGVGFAITGSRGGLLAFAAAGIIFLILVPRRRFTLSALVLMLLGIVAVSLKSPVVMSRLAELVTNFSAAFGGTREYLWRAGIAMIRDHPWLGVGVGAFGPAFMQIYAYFNPYSIFYVYLSHTSILTILAETGFVGFTVFFLLISKTLHRGWQLLRTYTHNKDLRFLSAGVVAGVMAIVVSSQGEGRFYEEPLLWLLWAMLIAVNRIIEGES